MNGMAILVTVLVIAVLGLGVLVLGLIRRVTTVLEGAERQLRAAGTRASVLGGLPPGSPVPPYRAVDRQGTPVGAEILQGDARLVLFVDAGCDPCMTLLEDLRQTPLLGRGGVPILVVATDTPAARRLPFPATATVLFQRDRAVARAFASEGTPHAFFVDANGIVGRSTIPSRSADLIALFDSHTDEGTTRAQTLVATLVPSNRMEAR